MKDRIKDILGNFFISVTLINVAMLVLGSILMPQQQFGYEVFIYPLIYGVIGVIPAVIVREGRELSVKQMAVRHVIQMLLTVVLLLAFMFGGRKVDQQLILYAVCVAVSVVIIYAGVVVISWFLDKKTADRMTEDLIRFQERQNSGL